MFKSRVERKLSLPEKANSLSSLVTPKHENRKDLKIHHIYIYNINMSNKG